MQANWSIILNILLLICVVVAIRRLMNTRKQNATTERYQPSLGKTEVASPYDAPAFNDDIIAVRKVATDHSIIKEFELNSEHDVEPMPTLAPKAEQPQLVAEPQKAAISAKSSVQTEMPATVMFFLLAKENRQFAGYELLQTVLAAGLRFGEGHLFHRHQFANGQGPVICSLAAATATGVFDLQNIGAFSVRGLCLYMQVSRNPVVDAERFTIMLETARLLSDGMDAHLLDEARKPLTSETLDRYKRMLHIEASSEAEYA